MYIYLYLNLFTIFFPFILSFDKRVQFYKNWPALFPAILANALLFILWDSIFTRIGVWGFNPEYLVGWYFFGLPLEEILFFFTVPYACVFIYETLNTYIKKDYLYPYAHWFILGLLILLVPLGLLFLPRLYTSITFLGLAIMLVVHYLLLKKIILGRFFTAYFVHLIPFLLVNGVLTALPVVWYNNQHNLGLRITTIPAEDTMYSMLMLLITITIYELLKRNKTKQITNTVV